MKPIYVCPLDTDRSILDDAIRLNIFSELFPVAPELALGYVVATIDVKEKKLRLFLDKTQVDEFKYKLR
jgi:putative transposase